MDMCDSGDNVVEVFFAMIGIMTAGYWIMRLFSRKGEE